MEDAQDDAWQVEREYFEDECLVDAEADKADTEVTQPPEDGEKEGDHGSQDEDVCQDDPYDPYVAVNDVKTEIDLKQPVVPVVPVAPDLQLLIPKLLRFLGDATTAGTVADAASNTLVAASRRLWRLGALEPQGYGLPPKLTPLGIWLAKCSTDMPDLPPAAMRALFSGALWGCLVPLAALVALLLPLNVKPKKSLRNMWRSRLRKGFRTSNWSGHFVLVASYLKWKESQAEDAPNHNSEQNDQLDGEDGEPEDSLQTAEETEEAADATPPQSEGVSPPNKNAVRDGFWEAVDEKVVALCEFVRTNLGYNGHDVSDANEGNIPWTVTSLLMRP
eukprot:s165_g37.t2